MSEDHSYLTNFPHLIYQREHNDIVHSGQCDCCVYTSNRIADIKCSELLTDSLYILNNSLLYTPLTPDYYTVIGKNSRLVNINSSALELAMHFRQARLLKDIPSSWQECQGQTAIQSILTQMTKLGLLLPETYTVSEHNEYPETLSAWLQITDNCNLQCAYCYVPRTNAEMSSKTGHAVVNAVFRSALNHGYKEINLKYAGGEPLLCFELVSELHQYAQMMAEQYNIALNGVVLSNGTLLTPSIIKQILNLDLDLVISLDGLEYFHDCQRFHTGGHTSFKAVSQAIDLAVSHNLVPGISITVSSRNVRGLPELIKWILERDLPFSINFYREHNRCSTETDLKLEEETIIEGMLCAYKVIEAILPHKNLPCSLADHADFSAPHLHTCSAGNSYLVFDHKGCAAKCQMDINNTVTDASAPDPLLQIRNSSKGIQNFSAEEKNGCKKCKWRYWCAGGCPLSAYRATGRYDVKSPNCNIYKALCPEVLRLEGLGLLYS
ncbi:MAG: SPASM domain-containing protein [Desulfobacteraceae bacterium]|nr:SPASM domain-containing protein [Desulfobacteraceae bacterium]